MAVNYRQLKFSFGFFLSYFLILPFVLSRISFAKATTPPSLSARFSCNNNGVVLHITEQASVDRWLTASTGNSGESAIMYSAKNIGSLDEIRLSAIQNLRRPWQTTYFVPGNLITLRLRTSTSYDQGPSFSLAPLAETSLTVPDCTSNYHPLPLILK